MASNMNEAIYDVFARIAGAQAENLPGVLADVLGATVTPSQTAKAPATGETVVSKVLQSGLGMLPLVNGILSLFRGGATPPPEPLVKYAMPARLDIVAAATSGGITSADFDQSGLPRAYGKAPSRPGEPILTSSGSVAAQPAQITVNVQAMDARSFLDRSTDIAAAVREAMLHTNSINDVISEL